MAHTLSLVYGSTTIALASGDYRVREYTPRTAEPGAVSVEETAVIQVYNATLATWQTDIRAINKAFEMARLRQQGRAYQQVFIQFQGDSEAAAWQSEIYDGRVLLPDTALQADWANRTLDLTIIWSRAPFWEATSWTSLSLTNGNGTDVTTGIRVFTWTDGTGSSPNVLCNYVDVDDTEISGDLPAPVKLRIKPGSTIQRMWISCHNDLAGLGLVSPYTEAESWSAYASGGSASDSDDSNGSHKTLTLAADTWNYLYLDRDLSTYNGGMWRFFIRHSMASGSWATGLKTYVSMRSSGTLTGIELQSTQTVIKGTTYGLIMPIGDLHMPPGRRLFPLSADLKDFQLRLYFYLLAGGTIYPDAVYWMPLDSFVEISTTDGAIYSTDRLVYANDLEGHVYLDTAATGNDVHSIFDIVRGAGIWLHPGVDHRIFFLDEGVLTKAQYLTVEAWYKPRRSSL